MPKVFAAEISADTKKDRALRMLCNPTTVHRMFGADAASEDTVALIVPDNDILGSVLARKAGRLRPGPGESRVSVSSFCQKPTASRFSIVVYRRENVLDIAGFTTISWSLARDVDADGPGSDADPGDFTLCIDLETMFIDYTQRRNGYASALMRAATFWFENFLVDLDRKAAQHGNDFQLSIIFTADASPSFDKDVVDRFMSEIRTGYEKLIRQRSMSGFTRVIMETDISQDGSELIVS